jgi:hypothetical protein
MTRSEAEIIREYGPFPGVEQVHGVTYDGTNLWFASDGGVKAVDPEDGRVLRTIDMAAHAGTAYDGRHLFQISEDRIHRIHPEKSSPASLPPATAAIPASPGRRARYGSENIAAARSTRSIRKPARLSASSEATAW